MASQSPRGVWGEFVGASEAPASAAILAEGATRKFAQGTAARRVELKMDRRRRCFSVAGRKGTCSLRRALAACHFELNDCKGIPVTQHWLERLQPWLESVRT